MASLRLPTGTTPTLSSWADSFKESREYKDIPTLDNSLDISSSIWGELERDFEGVSVSVIGIMKECECDWDNERMCSKCV